MVVTSQHKQQLLHSSQHKNRDVTEWLVEDLQGAAEQEVVVNIQDDDDAANEDLVEVDQ